MGGSRLMEGLGVSECDKAERALLKMVNQIDLIVVRGERTKRYFQERGVETTIVVSPSGVDASALILQADRPKEFDIITVGRINRVKRHDILARVAHRLKDRFPNLKVALVGDGEERSNVEKLVGDLGLDSVFVFAGEQTDVARWLGRSRVFVLTSDSEGLSQALVEAMICGLPAVVSDVGELGSVVEDGKNGFLVQDQDVAMYADRIEQLLADGSGRDAMGRAAASVRERESAEAAITFWERLLASPSTLSS